jgi:hypothetical protein
MLKYNLAIVVAIKERIGKGKLGKRETKEG